ncbi:cobalamin-binding protein [Hydrogenovibrio kuenenii]|uniref:cobalamin-binding protein n=1 Tax=Hydrogenovibrio kuenenii TaxID=63658 RepID=UPI000463FFC4|nr:cobalamin-binding protein [Hydrogenovibrio kuenenii]
MISLRSFVRSLALVYLLSFGGLSHAEDKAFRIISLSPHLTEMVFSAGAGKDLVGVDTYSNYPSQVKQLPKVGDAFHLNFEQIIALKPNLILAWQASIKPQDLKRLKDLGLSVFVSSIQTLNDIPNNIEEIGRRAGTQQHAFSTAQALRHRLNFLRQKYSDKKPVTVFYEVWNQPLITINRQQFISQGLALCGAQNVFEDLAPIAPQVNMESILMKNPQMILMGGPKHNQKIWRKDWQAFPMLQAVKNHQIIGGNSDLYQRPTERFIEALPQLCAQVNTARKVYAKQRSDR